MEIRQLVEKAKAGDRNSFAVLVARYQRVAITKALSVVNDFHFAQDMAQDAFVIAFRQLASLKDSAAFGPWLLEIVRRQSLKALRRTENFRSIDSEVENDCVGREPEWREQHAALIQAIRKLPDHEQDVVVLFYLEELSTKKVAQYVDRPIGTVTKQLSRGVTRLRSLLTEVSHDPK